MSSILSRALEVRFIKAQGRALVRRSFAVTNKRATLGHDNNQFQP